MKSDQFSKPMHQRTCPDGVVPEVWAAFVETTIYKTPEERHEKWLYYLSIHGRHYDELGNKKATAPTANTAQTSLF